MRQSLPRRTRFRALITCTLLISILLAARARALSSLEDRTKVERDVREKLRAFVNNAGRPLQVGAMVDPDSPGPFVRRVGSEPGSGETGRLVGASIDQMLELSIKYDFRVEFFEMVGDGFNGVVADVGGGKVKGENGTEREVDVGVQLFTANGVRSLKARQTTSPIESEMVFLAKREELLGKGLFDVFKVFRNSLWGLIAGILIVLAINLAIIAKFPPPGSPPPERCPACPRRTSRRCPCESTPQNFPCMPARKMRSARGRLAKVWEFWLEFWDNLYNLGCLLFGQLPNPSLEDTPSRLIYILFKAFSFALVTFYTALLVSQFQTNEDDMPVSMKTLCNPSRAGNSLKDLVVADGTSFKDFVVNYLTESDDCTDAKDEGLKLFDVSESANICSNAAECRDRVLEGKAYVTIEDAPHADWLLSHGLCKKMQKVGLTGNPTASAWILPRTANYSSLSQTLSSAILLARDDGSFDRITETVVEKRGCKVEELERVDILNLTGYLGLMGLMLLSAWVLQLWKWHHKRLLNWFRAMWLRSGNESDTRSNASARDNPPHKGGNSDHGWLVADVDSQNIAIQRRNTPWAVPRPSS